VKAGESTFRERMEVADASILDLFNLPLVVGDRETVFASPHSMLVTESTSKRWFGDESPVGKTVFVESKRLGGEYQITGLLKNISPNSVYQLTGHELSDLDFWNSRNVE